MDEKNEVNRGVPEASASTTRALYAGGGAEVDADRRIWARKKLTAV